MEHKITLEDIRKIPLLTDREYLEAYLAVTYAREFNHGTDGHIRLGLTDKLIKNYLALLELNARLEAQLVELVKEGK